MGKHFTLSPEGKGALALFALAATWWIFEVLPIGVTGIANQAQAGYESFNSQSSASAMT